MSYIDIVYLITSQLHTLPKYLSNGYLIHSALLLKTIDGQYFKLDSGIKGSFHQLYSDLMLINNFSFVEPRKIKINNDISTWTIEVVHILPKESNKTVFDAQKYLYILSIIKPYHLINWNCHTVQELVREYLGIKVKNKYTFKRLLLFESYN